MAEENAVMTVDRMNEEFTAHKESLNEALEEMGTADDLFGLRMTRTISIHNLRNVLAVKNLMENPDNKELQDAAIHLFFSRFTALMSVNPETLLEMDMAFGADMIEMVISYFDDGVDNFKFRQEVVDSYLSRSESSPEIREAVISNLRSVIEVLDRRIAELS